MSLSLLSSGFLLLISTFLCTVLCQDGGDIDYYKDTNHVFKTIFFKYNKRIRPYEANEPSVSVNLDMSLVRITEVDKVKNEIEAVFDVTVHWKDLRLYWYSDIKYVTVNASTVWTPDVEFLNAVKAPEPIIKPRFVLIDYNGQVFWSRRFLLRTTCVLNETATSHDCSIILGSYQLSMHEQNFGDVNCSLDDGFSSSNVEISDLYMIKSERSLKSHVFKNATASEAHCIVFFKENKMPVQHGETEKLSTDNGQNTIVLNTGIMVLSVIGILLKNNFAFI